MNEMRDITSKNQNVPSGGQGAAKEKRDLSSLKVTAIASFAAVLILTLGVAGFAFATSYLYPTNSGQAQAVAKQGAQNEGAWVSENTKANQAAALANNPMRKMTYSDYLEMLKREMEEERRDAEEDKAEAERAAQVGDPEAAEEALDAQEAEREAQAAKQAYEEAAAAQGSTGTEAAPAPAPEPQAAPEPQPAPAPSQAPVYYDDDWDDYDDYDDVYDDYDDAYDDDWNDRDDWDDDYDDDGDDD